MTLFLILFFWQSVCNAQSLPHSYIGTVDSVAFHEPSITSENHIILSVDDDGKTIIFYSNNGGYISLTLSDSLKVETNLPMTEATKTFLKVLKRTQYILWHKKELECL